MRYLVSMGVARMLAVLLGASWAFAAAAPAADTPRHPNLSGFYDLARGKVVQDKALLGKLPPGTAMVDDVGANELPAGDWGGLKPTPAALEQASKWDIREQLSVSKVCEIPSIVYAMQGPFPIEIHQGTELIVIKMEYYDMVRIIFLDQKAHPKGLPLTKEGHSIGRWEGDTLVVDTVALKPSTILNNGLDHSDQMHVLERFKMAADGKTLHATAEYDDPAMLQNHGGRYIAWTKKEGDFVHAYDCDPSFAENYAK